jgi:hypothetical protein
VDAGESAGDRLRALRRDRWQQHGPCCDHVPQQTAG